MQSSPRCATDQSVVTTRQNTGASAAIIILFPLLLSCEQTSAQTFQFLPEVDAYYKIQSRVQFAFQAKETREAGEPTQAEIGPSFNFFLKPLVRLKEVTLFDLDDAKSRPLLLSIGYRYVPSVSKPPTQRAEPVLTFHLPLAARILFSDRNRGDLDWSQGRFTWRHRNRPTLERRVTIRSTYSKAFEAVVRLMAASRYPRRPVIAALDSTLHRDRTRSLQLPFLSWPSLNPFGGALHPG